VQGFIVRALRIKLRLLIVCTFREKMTTRFPIPKWVCHFGERQRTTIQAITSLKPFLTNKTQQGTKSYLISGQPSSFFRVLQ
jgi:hypothetical protein